jgi:hypothetical protein
MTPIWYIMTSSFEGTCCLYPQTAMKMGDGYGKVVPAFQRNMMSSSDGGSMFL